MPKLEKGTSPDYHEYMRWRVRTDAEIKARGVVPLADGAMYQMFQDGLSPKEAATRAGHIQEIANGATTKARKKES